MNRGSNAWYAVPAIGLFFTLASNAHGYIDSGSGSYFVQVLLAGALGASFMAKNAWIVLRAKFSRSAVRSND